MKRTFKGTRKVPSGPPCENSASTFFQTRRRIFTRGAGRPDASLPGGEITLKGTLAKLLLAGSYVTRLGKQ